MRFCDKLQKLRKENNITQEGLADKLNVSRQAVSKWESGSGYPDTEKLIMISKIFKVSLDELINDGELERKDIDEKINIKDLINKMLDFLSKTINMFSSMKFKEKIKCLFEMGLIILSIVLVSLISINIVCGLIRKIFIFLPDNLLYIIINLVDVLFYIIFLVLGIIITIKIFKIRYLDYYVFIEDDTIDNRVIEKPIPELQDKEKVKVVIRDPKDSSLNIFEKIWSFCLWIMKICGFFISIPVILMFIFLMGIFIISLFYFSYGLLFNGISVAILGLILFTYLLIEFIYNLIFNREHKFRRIFIIFIISISLMGIGFGLSISDISNFSIVKEDNDVYDSKIIQMKDDLILADINYLPDDRIKIDNSIDYIKIDIVQKENIDVYMSEHIDYDYEDMKNYTILYLYAECDEFNLYKDIVNNLKEKKILINDRLWEIDKIYISDDNLTKIKDNYANYVN